MNTNDALSRFLSFFQTALDNGTFVRLTLSKPGPMAIPGLRNVYIRRVQLKAGERLAFTFRYENRDEVKNLQTPDALEQLGAWLPVVFQNAQLLTTTGDVQLQFNNEGKAKLRQLPASQKQAPATDHNRAKQRFLQPSAPWLHRLGIANAKGEVLPSAQDKWKQINKYLEIMDALFRSRSVPHDVRVVDMGSGKGYLTFALFDYLVKVSGLQPQITGVELRPELVEFCNRAAREAGFDGLAFVAEDIAQYQTERIDVLIALHACDTATDLALAQGIHAKAGIVVVAPCCHKQVRKAMHTQNEMAPLMKHGILEERQAELLTDGIRALLLESEGYATKVFEFVSTEHTAKNVMITATKLKSMPESQKKEALEKVSALKSGFGIQEHYLETLL